MEDRREYRIDELAAAAGTTVRNVRAYQDRGLLASPRREGRVGIYSEAHLARLRVIGSLLDRGYTLANISELVAAWEEGNDIGAVLGFEAALGARWSSQAEVTMTRGEVERRFGDGEGLDDRALGAAVAMGLVEPEGDGFRIPNPSAFEVGELLVAAGVPLGAILEAAERLRVDVDDIAGRFVDLVDAHVFEPIGGALGREDLSRLAELIDRLRPLSKRVVEVELARAMERHIGARFGAHLERFVRAVQAGKSEGVS